MLALHALALIFDLTHYFGTSPSVTTQIAHVVYSVFLLLLTLSIVRAQWNLREKLFWFCIRLAIIIWLITKISLLVLLSTDISDWMYLLADYGYFAFFMVVGLAHVFFHQQDQNARPGANTLAQITAISFMSGLFVYMVVVPSQASPTEFQQHYSSFLFYILMDMYLCCLFTGSALTNPESHWRERFAWFAASFALFLVLDLIELAVRAELVTFTLSGPVTLLWYLPYISLAMAIVEPKPLLTLLNPLKNIRVRFPELSFFALILLPLIHFFGHQFTFFATELRTTREGILILWIVAFAVFAYLSRPNTQNKSIQDKPVTNDQQDTPSLSGYLDKHPFPGFLLDKLGRIIQCNSAAAEKFKYAQENLSGTFFSGLLAKDEPLETMLRFSESSFSQSKLITQGIREAYFIDSSDEQLICYVAFRELEDGQFLVSLVDIGRLHEAELQALDIKDKFLANITHEFRTPLTIIQGALDEGIEQVESATLLSRLRAAKTNSIRILKMVEQLLNLSKITSAPKLDKSLQPASQIIEDTCSQFYQLCRSKKIQFTWHVGKNIWIKVYDDSLQQVLYNLLSNAYKYSATGSQINLTAVASDNRLKLTISDSGCGITEEEKSRLFERFQRADGAKRSTTFGVGIGLSLVSELVAVHEWRIAVDSTLNKGTTFTLEIPCQAGPGEAHAYLHDTRKVEFETEESLNPSTQSDTCTVTPEELAKHDDRLLIIEDNSDMQEYLLHLMSDLHDTEIAKTGQQGINRAIEDIPDVIICDLMLPDITGFEVIKQLKSHPLTQHIPILMLTAKSDTQSKLQGLELQADDYLTKPFHHKELQLRINNLLQIRARLQSLLRQQLQSDTLDLAKSQCLPDEAAASNVIPHQTFLDKLQTCAQQNFSDEEFSPSLLATELAMSERQLQRKLKAALNMTPGEYLREYRIIKSKEYISRGMTIGRVAEEVGFANQNYFTRCFKQQCGITPSEYQKSTTSNSD